MAPGYFLSFSSLALVLLESAAPKLSFLHVSLVYGLLAYCGSLAGCLQMCLWVSEPEGPATLTLPTPISDLNIHQVFLEALIMFKDS